MKKRLLTVIIAACMVLSPLPNVGAKASSTMDNANTIVNKIKIGWNLGNSMDSYYNKHTPGYDAHLDHETIWGNPKVTKDLIKYVKSLGFNAIRVPVTWTYNSKIENGHLVVGKKWMTRVHEIVDYAIDNDMYVIVDSHHDMKLFSIGVSDKEFKTLSTYMKDLWTQVGKEFKNYDDRLLFESFNEIYSKSDKKWGDPNLVDSNAIKQYNQLNQTFADAVRATGGRNKNRVLVLGCPLSSCNQSIIKEIKLPKDSTKNAYIYDAHAYNTSMDQSFEYQLEVFREFTSRTGAPVIFGECGSTGKYSPIEYRTYNATNNVSRAQAAGIKCFIWDNGSMGDYGIIDRKNFANSNTAMINAYMLGLTLKKGYENRYHTLLTGKNPWEYKQLKGNTGAVVKPNGWGYYTTCDNNGKGIKIPSNTSKLRVGISGKNESWQVELNSFAFYDKNGKYISGTSGKFKTKLLDIPANAAYIKVCIFDAYYYQKEPYFKDNLKTGDIKVFLSFLTDNPTGCLKASEKIKNEPNNKLLGKTQITKIKKVKKGTAKISFKKVTGATGYQVALSTSKSFKKAVKVIKTAKTYATTKKLKTKKRYYVRVRTYRKNGKKTSYSAWSKVKSFKL